MDQTFETVFGNYTVLVSLNERTIYFKIIDTINFTMYEGNTDPKELRVGFKLADIYQIITKGFKGVDGYNVKLSIGSGICKLLIDAKVGGFLEINFEVLLREKLMSNDSQLTLNFNKLEQKLNAGLAKLNQEISTLREEKTDLLNIISNTQIAIKTFHNNYVGYYINQDCFIDMNETKIEISHTNNNSSQIIWKAIKSFYQLEALKITGSFTHTNLKLFLNSSLKELIIQSDGQNYMQTIEGIENFPQLEKLTIINVPGLKDIPTILKSSPNKINYIKIQSCSQVNVIELQTYCKDNNIKLEIS